MFVFYSPFKYIFKIVHMPVLTRTHLKKLMYDDKMYISLIYNRTGCQGVKHQVTYLLFIC